MSQPELVIPTAREGLILRELEARDDEHFFRSIQANRDHLAQFGRWAIEKYQTVADVAMARLEQDEYCLRLGIWDDTEFAGSVTARHEGGWAEIGAIWIDVDHTRRGIATFVIEAIRDHLVRAGAMKVVADARNDNVAGVKLLEGAGFVVDKEPGPTVLPKNYVPYVYYAHVDQP